MMKEQNYSMSNVVFVSEPDVYLAEQTKLLFIADPTHSDFVVELLSKSKHSHTVYWATAASDMQWILNIGAQSEYIILDCKQSDFLTGFFIDKPNTFYYNNTINMNMINVNTINDAGDFVLQLLAQEE